MSTAYGGRMRVKPLYKEERMQALHSRLNLWKIEWMRSTP